MTPLSSLPLSDPARLSALAETALLDSLPENAFDQLTKLAGRILHTPVVLVTLVTDSRQFFKSGLGLPEPLASARETPLSYSLCQHVVEAGNPLIIPDTRQDPLVCDNLAVTDLGVRAYAGIPLTTSDGYTLGSFCAIDDQPRDWTEEEIATLATLADSVMAEIELRLAVSRARQKVLESERARRENAALLQSTSEGIYGIDRLGNSTFINQAAARMLGYEPPALLGRNMHQAIHAHRADGSPYLVSDCPIVRATTAGEACRVEDDVFWRSDETPFPVDYASSPLFEAGEVVGAVIAFSDITERKAAEAGFQATWARDRQVAETLQRAILHEVIENAYPGLAVASRYLPAWHEAKIGGDFYDAFPLEGGKVAFAVGDASGKGLAAAVRTAETKFALRAYLREDPSPETALTRLNNLLCASQRLELRADDTFIVLTLAIVDVANGLVLFGTAGAEPPLILRADGTMEIVQASGLPLGFLPQRPYVSKTLDFRRGDTLLIVTDGITEARSGQEFLGYEGMVELAQRAASVSTSVQEIAQAILEGAQTFAGGPLHDDACLFLIRRIEEATECP